MYRSMGGAGGFGDERYEFAGGSATNRPQRYGSVDGYERNSFGYQLPTSVSVDEFAEQGHDSLFSNKIVRTGRQRKKLAARSKGGEFQARRKKRRVYFCCVSSEIDIEQLHDHIDTTPDHKWLSRMYEGVLHLFMGGNDHHHPTDTMDTTTNDLPSPTDRQEYHLLSRRSNSAPAEDTADISSSQQGVSMNPLLAAKGDLLGHQRSVSYSAETSLEEAAATAAEDDDVNTATIGIAAGHPVIPGQTLNVDVKLSSMGAYMDGTKLGLERQKSNDEIEGNGQTAALLWAAGGKEVFIFDFGAVVFWGFHRGEEEGLLQIIREIASGKLSTQEFEEGRDDMAFITTSNEVEGITIANDVITLPDDALAKSRLSVSFAIAQSSVLAIFEARIERKVEEYKYIPETLATTGKVRLSPRQLGGMIGEVYVIRHDVNLHSEILDTPDFFWKESASIEAVYRLTMGYLEMSQRTEILNKRLDMLRELLGVLQQQHENAHTMKLEWIVIWLIVISVVVESVAILVNVYIAK